MPRSQSLRYIIHTIVRAHAQSEAYFPRKAEDVGVYCAFKNCFKNSTTMFACVSDFDWSRKLVRGGGDSREEVLRQFCE